MNLRTLVNTRRAALGGPNSRPKTIAAIAEECGVSRGYFYYLMAGTRSPSGDWFAKRLAKVLRVTQTTVRNAIAESAAAS